MDVLLFLALWNLVIIALILTDTVTLRRYRLAVRGSLERARLCHTSQVVFGLLILAWCLGAVVSAVGGWYVVTVVDILAAALDLMWWRVRDYDDFWGERMKKLVKRVASAIQRAASSLTPSPGSVGGRA